jgi:hypothetical protein
MTLLRGIAFFLFHANEEVTGKYILIGSLYAAFLFFFEACSSKHFFQQEKK